MRNFDYVTERQWKVSEAFCDMCGKKADRPDDPYPSFTSGAGGTVISSGTLTARRDYKHTSDPDRDQVDLCYMCAKWLMEQIQTGVIKRP